MALAEEEQSPAAVLGGAQHAPRTRAASIVTRTLAGAALAALVAGVLWLDALWQDGRVVALAGAGFVGVALWEYGCIAQKAGAPVSKTLLVAGGLAVFLSQWVSRLVGYSPWQAPVVFLCIVTLGVLVSRAAAGRVSGALQAAGQTAAGLVYVALSFSFIIAIRSRWGLAALATMLAVCKVTDTGAYYAGTLIGGRRLAPRVSPNKTVAGAVGGAAAAAALSVVLSLSGFSIVVGPLRAALYGVLIAAVAVLGDLAESVLKRQAGMKDSGQIMPGHGGVLDMVDDVLFAAPFSYLFFWLALAPT